MFGRNSKPCMVFEYGCLPPISGEQELIEELRRKNQYWNKLVEIERAHQERVRELLTVPDDPIAKIQEKIAELQEEIKQARKHNRSGKPDCSKQKGEIKKLREVIKALRPQIKEERRQIAEKNKELLKQLEEERRTALKEARKNSGLFWCNYDDEEKDYEAARKRAMKTGAQLRFHKFNGTGKVTVRYQTGLPVANAFDHSNNLLQIEPVSEEAWYHPVRAVRRKKARTVVRLRIQSENRKPVWVELPMVMHRPLPKDGEIRSASIVRERIGRKYRYKLIITVALESGSFARIKRQRRGIIAIDFGWRRVESGLRVAYWVDENGEHGQLVLPERIVGAFQQLKDLRSIRDKRFNEIKTELLSWMKEAEELGWLAEDAKSLSQWRSQERLSALFQKWQENRLPGDEEIFKSLQAWLKKENHLYDWEANLRDKVIRHRREIYRIFAAEIASKYEKVLIEDFDLRRVAQKPAPEDGTQGTLPMDFQRTIAAISVLRAAIENACRRENIEIKKLPAKYTTMRCHVCGYTEKFDAAAQIHRACPTCGELWDQDYNAAVNLLLQEDPKIVQGFQQNCTIRKNGVC